MTELNRPQEHIQSQLVSVRLQADLSKQWNVSEMSAVVGISPSQLRRIFARQLGTSPGRHLHELRLLAAARLLSDPLSRVKQVMHQVGFSHPSHFCRSFRRRFGLTPQEYRNRVLQEQIDNVSVENKQRW